MELYPVYVPLGKITTTTNLSAARSESLTVPDDPTYSVTPDTGLEQTVTLNADMDALLPNGSGDVYKLLRMTISVDGGVEIDLTTGDVNTGEYTYTPIEPGHSYLFTAYYQPYVVIFHQNGTEEMVTQLYNQYDHRDSLCNAQKVCNHGSPAGRGESLGQGLGHTNAPMSFSGWSAAFHFLHNKNWPESYC